MDPLDRVRAAEEMLAMIGSDSDNDEDLHAPPFRMDVIPGPDHNDDDDNDLPVAVPVPREQWTREQWRQERRRARARFDRNIGRRRRHLRVMQFRANMMANMFPRGDNNNNENDNNNGELEVHEQRILDQLEQNHQQQLLMQLPLAEAAPGAHAQQQPPQVPAPGAHAQQQPPQVPAPPTFPPVSPFLMDLIREGLPCSSVLSGVNVRGCAMIVQRCQTHPSEVHYQCPRTLRTPLHEAAWRCCCSHVIQALMNVDSVHALHLDSQQNTPLHLFFIGISNRRVDAPAMEEIVEQLLHPLPNMVGTIRNREGSLPLHCACAAPETMVPHGSIQRLIDPSTASRTNHKEQTPLHLHCNRRNASVEIAQLLVDAAPSALRIRDRAPGTGYTPLHYAAANSNRPLIELLATFDDVAVRTRTLISDKTPLHILCETNPIGPSDLACVQALLQVAPETALRRDHPTLYTPLHIVCRSTRGVSLEVVQALVQAGPHALALVDHNHYLPLHYACETGADPRVVECLLQAHPAATTVRTRKNDTALSLACAANHSVETVQLLLAANPTAALQANDYGFLPLHCVCRAYQASTAIVTTLVEACPVAVTKTTNAGETAMHLAGSNSGASIAILDVLTLALEQQQQSTSPAVLQERERILTSTVGNTPCKSFCVVCDCAVVRMQGL